MSREFVSDDGEIVEVHPVVAEAMALHEKGKPLTAGGSEVPDPVPMEPPVGYVRRPSLADQIRDMVRSERLRQEALSAGAESFDEADDFEVGDDFDPESPYEMDFDQASPAELRARRDAAEKPMQEEVPVPRGKRKASPEVVEPRGEASE